MNKFITAGIFTLMASTANAEAVNGSVQDHYKIVIEQAPYRVEVCKDVHVQGSNAGEGALGGMIIGGVLGKVLGGNDKGAAAGAILGGVVGANNSQGKRRITGYRTEYQCTTTYRNSSKSIINEYDIVYRVDGQRITLRVNRAVGQNAYVGQRKDFRVNYQLLN